jgi:hypothetical protein
MWHFALGRPLRDLMQTAITRHALIRHSGPAHMKVDTFGKPYLHIILALVND